MNHPFPEVKKNFGFGCMRLPMKDGEVDYEEFSKMVDTFLEAGFNYFDTAHGYIGGKSEIALRECLTKRYPRDQYIFVNKLSGPYFKQQEDIRPFFQTQLEACGVEYFDFYLMHAQNRDNFQDFKRCRAYETAFELREEGKIRHVGLSFHDTADVLDQILTEYPQLEVVQLQFNYADYEDASVQSRKCYEVCRKHQKPVVVMEPVKGGSLVNLPDEAKAIYDELGSLSYASYAVRFAAGFEGIFMTLSGMGNMQMMNDNISYMKDFKPLDDTERAAVDRVSTIIRAQHLIPCTACSYCTEQCPQGIPIPDILACLNATRAYRNWNPSERYAALRNMGAVADACVGCGACEDICPQHLPIRELLKEADTTFHA